MLGTSLKNGWFYPLSHVSHQYTLLGVPGFCLYHGITMEFPYIIHTAPRELPGGLLHLVCLNAVQGSKYPSTIDANIDASIHLQYPPFDGEAGDTRKEQEWDYELLRQKTVETMNLASTDFIFVVIAGYTY